MFLYIEDELLGYEDIINNATTFNESQFNHINKSSDLTNEFVS